MATTFDPSADGDPLLSFLVCTYHREDLLEACLRSLFALDGLNRVVSEILVVDNSDAETARQVVAGLLHESPVSLQYLTAHPANIAVARNRGVSAARGRFIAMIDDDMTVESGWLAGVQRVLEDEHYDVLCGPVAPVYEDPQRATPDSDAFFRRELDVQEPTPLRIMGPLRTRGFVPATSNCIFRRSACFSGPAPFDVHYGKSGGEDVDIFCRLERMGRRFAWVPAARTRELVPVRRCEFGYLEKRSFVGGQIYASTHVRNARSPALAALKISTIAQIQLGVLSVAELAMALGQRRLPSTLRLRRAAARGKRAWRSMVPIYEDEARSAKS